MENINSYVCIENELPETIIPQIVWYDSKEQFKVDLKRLEEEKRQTEEQINKQVKRGIIKLISHLFNIKPTEALSELKITATRPQPTRIDGFELYEPCQCGNSEQLISCPDCVQKLRNKQNKR